LLFVIPLFITYKSSRVFDSSYVKELALHEVSISYYSYLVKERACEKITESVLEYNLEHLVKSSEKLT
jgi:hypothetical protein